MILSLDFLHAPYVSEWWRLFLQVMSGDGQTTPRIATTIFFDMIYKELGIFTHFWMTHEIKRPLFLHIVSIFVFIEEYIIINIYLVIKLLK